MNGRGDLAILGLLALAAVGAFAATPVWIVPYPAQVPWYESPGFFPRAALALVAAGSAVEAWRRRAAPAGSSGGDEDLDARGSRPSLALGALALFAAYALAVPLAGYLPSTFAFVAGAAWLGGLRGRSALLLGAVLALLLWAVFAAGLKVAFGRPAWLDLLTGG